VRVLVVAPQVPWPLTQGTAIRNYHIVRQLARRHEVTVLAYGSAEGTCGGLREAGVHIITAPTPPPRSMTRRALDLGITTTPDLARRLARQEMFQLAADTARDLCSSGDLDVVQIEGLEMAPIGLVAHRTAAEAGQRAPLLAYDAHNAEWVLQDRAFATDISSPMRWHGALYSAVQTRKLRRYERHLLEKADVTIAVSDRDADALRELGASRPVAVVPNGVDTEAYRPAEHDRQHDRQHHRRDDGRDALEPQLCVFTGKMDFRPNVDAMTWFCTRVWPHVLADTPEARLAIVGRDPLPRVRALAGRSIEVTGAVEDIQPWLRRAGVVVVPLRVGGGTRLKVLEAMALAKAIAATTLAVEGLAVSDGREALLADEPTALAEAVTKLMHDSHLRAALGGRARELAVSEYRWEVLVPRIERAWLARP